MVNCLDCARLKREVDRLNQEVIRLSQMWLEVKKCIINQEQKGSIREKSHGN